MVERPTTRYPYRPSKGAVMAPTTVPKRTKALIQNGDMDIEGAMQIHKYWPEKLYGIEIEF